MGAFDPPHLSCVKIDDLHVLNDCAVVLGNLEKRCRLPRRTKAIKHPVADRAGFLEAILGQRKPQLSRAILIALRHPKVLQEGSNRRFRCGQGLA
jgi:hypothetical protein